MSVTASWRGGGARWSVLVHGGAGEISQGTEPRMVEGCRRAAAAAASILAAGGVALDAVQQAVEILEEDPYYNAGIGAALNSDGEVELDASIMEGESMRAGAVCAIRGFVHPVAIARAALEDGRHVLYAAAGAERFAERMGFGRVPPEALVTDRARGKLLKLSRTPDLPGGTVGAVARDTNGLVAAATSTGGTTGKRPGRVGDSPVLGAGTYADRSGAASATGNGEGILRLVLSARAVELAQSRGAELAAADALTLMEQRVNATGGLIVVDASGSLAWARTTPAMSWAAAWDGAGAAEGY